MNNIGFFVFIVVISVVLAGHGTVPSAELVRVTQAAGEGEHPGRTLYIEMGCNVCHGADRTGEDMGPPLTGLSEHYDTDLLVEYLQDPPAVVQRSDRLQFLTQEFRHIEMPSFGEIPEEQLRTLAEYLLEEES
jgi:cytochrome c553